MFRLLMFRYQVVTEITMKMDHIGPKNAEDEL
jgi:hypothetical protein